MKIVVLVKQVPDTWTERRLEHSTGRVERTGELVVDEICERAIEAALALKDADRSVEVTLLAMGPDSAKEALRKGLAMGADNAVHIVDDALAGSDAVLTSAAIASALRTRDWDLVLAGNESTDGRGGVVPAMVAELLGVASMEAVDSLEASGGAFQSMRSADGIEEVLAVELPAVVSITERMPDARFPGFRGILGAKKKPLLEVRMAALSPDVTTSWSEVVTTTERPQRQAGVRIVDDGNAAVAIAEFLAEQRLI